MSEPTTARTITGLTPRRPTGGGVNPDASRLLARNRAATPPPAPAPEQKPTPARPAERQTTKAQLNVAVHNDVRARIRAAYRATAHHEGHRSFSDFISAVLDAEARRLEAQYNDGRPFTGGDAPLAPGRPLDD